MHKIEQAIQVFLENIETAEVPEALIEEFGERCKDAIRKCLLAKRREEPFKLRMSNIGKPLRQLLLEKLYGRPEMNAQMRLKMTYGHIWESFLVFLLKASGLPIETNKKVELNIDVDGKNVTINGELDFKLEDEIYDTKSASPWSFDNKFTSFASMEMDDPFGYCGQAFSYSIADRSRFAGWLVIDKSDGRIKVVEVPQNDYAALARKYLDDFKHKIRQVFNVARDKEDIDADYPCTGIVKETFNKHETGNEYLTKSCEFCDCRYKCHPGLIYAEIPASKAKKKTWRYYTKLLKPAVTDE